MRIHHKLLLPVLLGFLTLDFQPARSETAESPCTINKMVQSPIASTVAFAVTYELDVFCKSDATARASIPKKLQSGADIRIAIADMFGHNAAAGKKLSLKSGQNTLFFTATSDKKPKPGEYKFSVDIDFSTAK
jgi:hypothetical protein